MAYYSALRPAVYHNCRNCHVGNNMVDGNLRRGIPKTVKGRKKPRLCKICARLRSAGKCIPGVPTLPKVHPGDTVETYYSKERPEIFHICQNCYLGQNIERNNLIANQPPIVRRRKKPRLCKTCVRLCIGGKCIPGTPIPARMGKPRLPVSKPRPRIPTAAAASK